MLAIVIPYYKKKFFRNTLYSLANQTDKRFRVYIGNDASPEDPTDIIEDYKDQIELTYKKFNENLGRKSLVGQWERCIDLINDEKWITILGDDDVYESNVVKEFYNRFSVISKWEINVVRFATYVIDEDNQVIGKLCKHPKKEMAADFLIRKFKGKTRSTLSEYFFKVDTVTQVKFKDFPMAWSSDTLAVVEFSQNKFIYTINSATISFRLSAYNITGQGDSIYKNESWFRFYTYLLENYDKQFSSELINLLLDRMEKTQLNNKKTPLRWVKFLALYLRFAYYSRLLALGPKIIKSIK